MKLREYITEENTRSITCKGCKRMVSVEKSYDTNRIEKTTGYKILMDTHGSFVPICSKCFKKIEKKVKSIIKTIGTDKVQLGHLIK